MKKRNLPPSSRNTQVKRQRDPLPWRYCLLTLFCGLILVGGFFYAAQQHFSAIGFGIKNAKLKQQKEDLETEQRRLQLAKEIVLSPGEIKKAAKKMGLQEYTASSIQYVTRTIDKVNPLASDKKSDPQAKSTNGSKIDEVKSGDKGQKSKTDKREFRDEKTKSQMAASGGDVRPRVAVK